MSNHPAAVLLPAIMDNIREEYKKLEEICKDTKCCMDALPFDFAYELRKLADQIDGGWTADD